MRRFLLPLIALALTPACKLDNPETTREVVWADAETEELARRACYDCHSNETHWPWYSYVPIVGNVVAGDVHRGRCEMNFSRWDVPQDEWDEASEKVLEGEMPLPAYVSFHKEARLTNAERKRLAAGLRATFAADPPPEGDALCEDDRGRDDDDRDDDDRDDDREDRHDD